MDEVLYSARYIFLLLLLIFLALIAYAIFSRE